MDILKEELVKKRQSLGGRKVFKRSEIEQKRVQKRREEDKRLSNDSTKSKPESSSISSLPKQDVVRRLRFLKQPVTLFGESDDDRLDRLKYVLEVDGTDEGQTKKRQNSGDQKRDENFKRMKTMNFSELSCDEDKIVVFLNKLLIEWKHELDQMTESEKRSAKGKLAFTTFKQCNMHLKPLFNYCTNKVLPYEIRQALMQVVNCCMKQDYAAASDHYVRIAIGNSTWPIGVTMVGIHERSAHEKIYTNSVAHVMNDETTRKYLTSVKRLVTFCESHHPAA